MQHIHSRNINGAAHPRRVPHAGFAAVHDDIFLMASFAGGDITC